MNAYLKLNIILFVLLLLFSSCSSSDDFEKTASFDWIIYEGMDPVYNEFEDSGSMFYNPVLAGFYPDPSICRAGDDFYMINSSFSYFPGIPIFHSRDLMNWEQIGNVLDRPSQLLLDSMGISRGIFASAIEYNNGIFYVVTTLVDRGGNFFVTATNPAGPWSDPIWLPEIDGIDPSFFFDDDNNVYIVHNGPPPRNDALYPGHRAIWMWQYDMNLKKMVDGPVLLVNGGTDISEKPVWIEGPHIYKKNGYYYLMAAEGGTAEDHSEVIFRSKLLRGPYIPYKCNPILTQRHLDPKRKYPVTSTGHADMIELPNGEWWAVFLGCRPYEDDKYNTGRETFLLPVTWKNDWPIILDDEKEVPYQLPGPSLEKQNEKKIPMNGNFLIKEDFNDTILSFYWNFIRTPHEKWYTIKDSKLILKLREEKIYLLDNPSFAGRRQQHMYFQCSVSMDCEIADSNQTAGLIAFYNKNNYLFTGKRMLPGGQTAVFLERALGHINNGDPVLITSKVIEDGNKGLQLKIKGSGRYYGFYYKTVHDKNWNLLIDSVDTGMQIMNRGTDFVGTFLGMYASSGHFKEQ